MDATAVTGRAMQLVPKVNRALDASRQIIVPFLKSVLYDVF